MVRLFTRHQLPATRYSLLHNDDFPISIRCLLNDDFLVEFFASSCASSRLFFSLDPRHWTLDRFGIATKRLKIHEKVNLLSPLFCSKRWLLLNNGILLVQITTYHLPPCKPGGVPG